MYFESLEIELARILLSNRSAESLTVRRMVSTFGAKRNRNLMDQDEIFDLPAIQERVASSLGR